MHVSIFTDMAFNAAPRELAEADVKDVVATFGGEIRVMPTSGNWSPGQNNSPLKLAAVLDRLDQWAGPIARFIAAIQQYDKGAAE